MAPGGGRLVVFDEDRLGAEGGEEFAELGAAKLDEFGRRGRAGPALEQGEGGEECRGRRGGEVEFHLEGHGVAHDGGGQIGREVETKHVAGGKIGGNKVRLTWLPSQHEQ